MRAVKSSAKRESGAIVVPSSRQHSRSRHGPPKAPPVSLPTSLEVRGVPIHFPFQPYPCQEDYMGKVLDALLRSENALLESPTGTGKTLCLLCATLAWQREEARRLHDRQDPASFAAAGAATSTTTKAKTSRRVPTIIYASRTHSQLSQVVRELRTTRYRPKHAVLGSREQMCVNPKVKRPGVSGADINHDCSRLGQERKCKFRNKLEGFTAPGNESGGGGASFYGTQPVRDMEDLVTMGTQHQVCPFYYTRSLVEDAELILVPYNYLFDKDSRTTTLAEVPWDNAVLIFDEAHNLESFASESASFDLTTTDIAGCLLEIQRAVNYLQTFGSVDDGSKSSSSSRPENIAKIKTIFLKLEEYIMNSLNQQTSAYKGEFMMELFHKGCGINHANHELFIQEIRKLTEIFLQFGGGSNISKQGGGAPKLDHFVQCVKRVFGEPTEARCLAKAQSYRVHITPKQAIQAHNPQTKGKGSKNNNSYSNNTKSVGRTVSYWCFAPSEAMRELAKLNVRSIMVTSGTLSPLESYALELDLPFPNRLENPHIIPDDQIHVRVVGKGVSNKLLTSSYERRQDAEYYTELGNTLISLGKVIPKGMLVFFPSYGVMEACMERWGGPASSGSRYQQGRQDGSTNSFFAARKRKPTGTARYSFPHAPHTFSASKEVMTPWKRLLGVKAVVVEPRSTADLPDAINEFHKFLGLPKSKGVALFGVCRGKISEGIDFAHDMCRAVIITGLPFAPSFDPKIRMKREFLDHNRLAQNVKASTDGGFGKKEATPANASLSGHEWYTQQAHRAVNQAIGRVIRNKNDYGAVLLLDNRFGLPANQKGLSKWVRPHLLADEGMGRTIGGLVQFYKQAAKKVEERDRLAALAPPPAPPNPVSIILKYEDEEEGKEDESNEDEFTKIAFVGKETKPGPDSQPMTQPADGEDTSPSKSYIRPDRIIARVDMKADKDSERASRIMGADTPDAHEQFSVAESKQLQPNSTRSKQNYVSTEKSSLSPAQRFFTLVQARMTPSEQSIIKKAAVAMKPLTDPKYRPQFLKTAAAIIRIILSHETFENRPRDDIPEMLMLIMQLFPAHFRRDAQKWTIAIAFDRSSTSKLLKESMSSTQYGNVRPEVVSLLRKAWFQTESGEYPSANSFLATLERVLSPHIALKGRQEQVELCSALLKLVPSELHGNINALFEQFKASMMISKMKVREKAVIGEATVEVARFRSSIVKIEPGHLGDSVDSTTDPATITNATLEQKPEVEPKASMSSGSQTKRTNPYAKQSNGSEAVAVKLSGSSGEAGRPVKMRRGVLASIVSHRKDASTNSLNKVLQESRADIYTGKGRLNVTRAVNSNAPKDLKCKICENGCQKPLIAECNHVACRDCWVRWLNTSQTCPTCRKPAGKESLALLVFKES